MNRIHYCGTCECSYDPREEGDVEVPTLHLTCGEENSYVPDEDVPSDYEVYAKENQ